MDTKIKSSLSSVLTSEKNIKIFCKYITKFPASEQRQITYSVIGDICNGTDIKIILDNLKSKKVLWDHPIFSKINSKIQEHDEYLVNPFSVENGVIECVSCGSMKTISFQKQTRSADEPMTTFCACVDCGKNWTQNR